MSMKLQSHNGIDRMGILHNLIWCVFPWPVLLKALQAQTCH